MTEEYRISRDYLQKETDWDTYSQRFHTHADLGAICLVAIAERLEALVEEVAKINETLTRLKV